MNCGARTSVRSKVQSRSTLADVGGVAIRALPRAEARAPRNARGSLLALVVLIWAERPLLAANDHWVATWACGPQLTEARNLPPAPLADSTLRQFVHVTLGGKQLRVRFSNAYGTNPVTIDAAHIALATGAGSAMGGTVDPATDKALTFRGAKSLTIPAGEAIVSDPLEYQLPALTNLAISICFGAVSPTTITGHPGARTTAYLQAGKAVAAPSMAGAATTDHWYIITGVDVLAGTNAQALVVLGDSLTDGRGSTTDGNNRWPDDLAQRLAAHPATADVAVANMGIGGNGIFGGLGPPAEARMERDVLEQSGARWMLIFEGVNDIGGASADRSPAVAAKLIGAYEQFIAKAHARNLRAYGATLTPFGSSFYSTAAHETARQTVNAWIRTNNLYDAIIDFDAVVRDPLTRTNLVPAYDSGDHLHLNPAGYQAMANAIDLSLCTR